jgi:preprotein translocase subunit SecY
MALLQQSLERGDWLFNVFYVSLIVFFCFFYTAVTFQAVDVADNLRSSRRSSQYPAGQTDAEYIDKVMTASPRRCVLRRRVCVARRHREYFNPFRWGTSIMIVVASRPTPLQIEAHLITRHYEGLSGGGGRRHACPREEGRRCGSARRSPGARHAGQGHLQKWDPQIPTGDMLREARSGPPTSSTR